MQLKLQIYLGLVADSGYDTDKKTKFINDNKIDYTKLPFDSGICIGRNVLVNKVKTKYVLIGDDDFKYSKTAKIQEMIDFLEANKDIDLIGGRILENEKIRDYQGFMSVEGDTLKYQKLELDNFNVCKKTGLKYKTCDLTFNFFVARTDAVKKVLWNEDIKVRYEHSCFFLDFKKAGFKVAFSPEPIVIHKPKGITFSKEYSKYRNRYDDKHSFFKYLKINKIIDMNGVVNIDENIECCYSDVTFIIKTFKRYEALERLLFSIKKFCPRAKVFIGDDSEKNFNVEYYKNLWNKLDMFIKPTAYNLPFDSGISYGRNKLVKYAETPYILLLDDDFVFTEKTNIEKMIEIIKTDKNIGIVGGSVLDDGTQKRHFEHLLEKKGRILYHIKDGDNYYNLSGYKVKETGCVLNFALIRKEVFNDVIWDDDLKVSEHTDFYLKMKDTKWKILYCPEVEVNHIHYSTKEYKEYRRRDEFVEIMMKNTSLSKSNSRRICFELKR